MDGPAHCFVVGLLEFGRHHLRGRKKIGKLTFPAGELDLTAAVRPGGKHLLSLFVEALPLKETMLAFNDTNMPQETRGSVKYRGLCGDVFLASTPAQARVTNVKVDPSVRRWALTVHADLAKLASGADYRLQAKISDQGQLVKTLVSAAFKDADLENGRFSFTQPWKPEKLWDLNTPENQYDLELSLLDGDGQLVDVFLPVRFGFREFWIEGRDFMLNGTRIFWDNKPLDNPTLGAGDGHLRRRQRIDQAFAERGHQYGLYPQLRLQTRDAS